MLASLSRRILSGRLITQLGPACRHARPSRAILPPTRHLSSSVPVQRRYTRFDDGAKHSEGRTGTEINGAYVVFPAILGGATVYYLYHLEKVPETGRWRFIDMSAEAEAKLWVDSYGALIEEYRDQMLPPNHPITVYVHKVASQILEANNLGTLKSAVPYGPDDERSRSSNVFGRDDFAEVWDSGVSEVSVTPQKVWNLFVVNDNNTINAMTAPGSIVVFTGILPIADNKDGLAAVLSHEIGHIVLRHSVERFSYFKVLFVVSSIIEFLGVPSFISRVIATLVMDLPNSRKHELEADKIGLRLAAHACFNPQETPEMFKRLGAGDKSGVTDFVRTHPAADRRVAALEAQLHEAYAIQAASGACAGLADHMTHFKNTFARW